MSESDRLVECPHCHRSIPGGKQCSCLGACKELVRRGKPDGEGHVVLDDKDSPISDDD